MHVYGAERDVTLGYTYRGRNFDVKAAQYYSKSPLLRSIQAAKLFESLGYTHEALKASPLSYGDLESQLATAFAVKMFANILDAEALQNKESLDVPAARMNYAVRKILLVDLAQVAGETETANKSFADLFELLKSKIEDRPQFYEISWNPVRDGKGQKNFGSDQSSGFDEESWEPSFITIHKPQSYDDFWMQIRVQLENYYRAMVRERTAYRLALEYYKNRDLLNPSPTPIQNEAAELPLRTFNRLSSLLLQITSQDMQKKYEELKDELAAVETNEFIVTEIVLGSVKGKAASEKDKLGALKNPKPENLDPTIRECALAFHQDFEAALKQRVSELQIEIASSFETCAPEAAYPRKKINFAREQVVSELYSQTLKKIEPKCAQLPARISDYHLNFSGEVKDIPPHLTEIERARYTVVIAFIKNAQLQQMELPWVGRIDSQGNSHLYFVKKRGVRYLPLNDVRVDAKVRDAIAQPLIAQRLIEGLTREIDRLYTISVNSSPFNYAMYQSLTLPQSLTQGRVTAKKLLEQATKTECGSEPSFMSLKSIYTSH